MGEAKLCVNVKTIMCGLGKQSYRLDIKPAAAKGSMIHSDQVAPQNHFWFSGNLSPGTHPPQCWGALELLPLAQKLGVEGLGLSPGSINVILFSLFAVIRRFAHQQQPLCAPTPGLALLGEPAAGSGGVPGVPRPSGDLPHPTTGTIFWSTGTISRRTRTISRSTWSIPRRTSRTRAVSCPRTTTQRSWIWAPTRGTGSHGNRSIIFYVHRLYL